MFRRILYRSFLLAGRIKVWGLRRLTPAGLMLLACLVLAGVFGLNTNLTLAYQAFTFLLAVLILALASNLVFRPRLTIQRRLPRFGSVGRPLNHGLLIHNESRRSLTGISISEEPVHQPPSQEEFLRNPELEERKRNFFDRTIGYHRWLSLVQRHRHQIGPEQTLPDLKPGNSSRINLELTPGRRGRLRLAGPTLARLDTFGLTRTLAFVPAPASILILPKRYNVPPTALPGLRKYQPGGVALASSVGDSEEFVSLRDYRPGDPLRRIHWKSWAKTEKPIVKEYQDEYFIRHALILDTFVIQEPDDAFEEAVSVAASFALNVMTQDSLLDLMFVGPTAYSFTTGRGLIQADRLLEILASVNPCRDKPFSALPPLILSKAAQLSACILVLLAWDLERQALVRRLKGLKLPLKVLVVTAASETGNLDPGPMSEAPADFHHLIAGRVEEGLARS
ncbi:MAG: DUF58 domain-containing protein [Thermodesulfobacteriota bacterium]